MGKCILFAIFSSTCNASYHKAYELVEDFIRESKIFKCKIHADVNVRIVKNTELNGRTGVVTGTSRGRWCVKIDGKEHYLKCENLEVFYHDNEIAKRFVSFVNSKRKFNHNYCKKKDFTLARKKLKEIIVQVVNDLTDSDTSSSHESS